MNLLVMSQNGNGRNGGEKHVQELPGSECPLSDARRGECIVQGLIGRLGGAIPGKQAIPGFFVLVTQPRAQVCSSPIILLQKNARQRLRPPGASPQAWMMPYSERIAARPSLAST